MRIVLGTTTRTQIKEFCPRANVGVLHEDGVDSETDIRWVHVPNGAGEGADLQADGDWLVEMPGGDRHRILYRILADSEFHHEYEAAE